MDLILPKLVENSERQAMNQPRLGFICGMPRSGTTWMGRILATHPKVAVFGESDFWGRDYLQPNNQGCYSRSQIRRLVSIQQQKDWQTTTWDDLPISGLAQGEYANLVKQALQPYVECEDGATPEETFRTIAFAVANRQHKPIAVEKTPGHLLFLDRIRQAYPTAPIAIMTREPFGFVASLVHRPQANSLTGRQFIRRFAYHPAIVTFWWRGYARSLLTQLDCPEKQLLVVDHEQLLADPEQVARVISTHLGAKEDLLHVERQPVNSSFKSSLRRQAPATTSFWLSLLASTECAALYPNVILRKVGLIPILVSWLTILPSVILFFVLYRPRAVSLLTYFFNFAREGTNLKSRT